MEERLDGQRHDGRLDGRRVLITGASSGIGAAIANTVARQGGLVALLARRTEVIARAAAAVDGVAVPADVTDVTAVRDAVDRAADRLGGLDAVVNAAGVVRPGAVAETDPAAWRQMLDVNLLGLLHVTQAVIPHLRAAGRGDVVNVASMSGRRLKSHELGVYAATKSAVYTVSEGLRRELAPDRIRVAVLAPGLVATALLDGLDDPTSERLRARLDETGLAAEDVADAAVRILAAPEHVVHVEIALLSLDQG